LFAPRVTFGILGWTGETTVLPRLQRRMVRHAQRCRRWSRLGGRCTRPSAATEKLIDPDALGLGCPDIWSCRPIARLRGAGPETERSAEPEAAHCVEYCSPIHCCLQAIDIGF